MMGGRKTVVLQTRPRGVGGYGSLGWDVSSNVLVGAVVVAQMGGWGTKGRSRGTGLMGADAATHSVVFVAVLAALLRFPTE